MKFLTILCTLVVLDIGVDALPVLVTREENGLNAPDVSDHEFIDPMPRSELLGPLRTKSAIDTTVHALEQTEGSEEQLGEGNEEDVASASGDVEAENLKKKKKKKGDKKKGDKKKAKPMPAAPKPMPAPAPKPMPMPAPKPMPMPPPKPMPAPKPAPGLEPVPVPKPVPGAPEPAPVPKPGSAPPDKPTAEAV